MYHIVPTDKEFDKVTADLEAAVKANGFSVLHIHDLGETLRSKGIAISENCRVFEVCNPTQASKVLAADMRLNMALPCRISVYTEGGGTKLGFIPPTTMLATLSGDPAIAQVAREVEERMAKMVDEAK